MSLSVLKRPTTWQTQPGAENTSKVRSTSPEEVCNFWILLDSAQLVYLLELVAGSKDSADQPVISVA